jgi:hypothetical protein
MNKINLNRSGFYHFADFTIRRLRDNLLDFTLYGLNDTILNDYESRLEYIDNMPVNDTENFSLITDHEQKRLMKVALLDDIRMMEVRILAKYDRNSIEFEQFGMKNMTKFTDEVLESKARAAYFFLNEKISELAQYGLTPAVLASFLDKVNDFADARLTWLNSRAGRLKNTIRRSELTYELYSEIQKWMTIGRIIYRKTNPLLYDYFVTYGVKKSYKLTPPTGLKFDPVSKTISWDAQPNATSYQLQQSTDNENFEEIYAGEETRFVLGILPTTRKFYKIRPRNTKGFGDYAETIVYNPN